jgi:REP-associated tyrosine transposase
VPRAPRILVSGGIYHVTTTACGERLLFRDNVDREIFEMQLAAVVNKHSWACGSMCLMGTHYHVLVVTPEGDLDAGMHSLNGRYAQTFNQRHGTRGHVFQSRYQCRFIQTDGHLLEVTRYIAMNPVRAGLCRRPGDWRWSSYRETIAGRQHRDYLSPAVVLDLFGGDPDLARARFQAFVEDEPLPDASLNRAWPRRPEQGLAP